MIQKFYIKTAFLSAAALVMAGCATPSPTHSVHNAVPDTDISYTPEWLVRLIPPQPGEPGALPDDRRPLIESDKNLQGAYGAGQILQQYGAAMEQGRAKEAYNYWDEQGQASGMDYNIFESSLFRYDGLTILTGRPTLNDDGSAAVPVQMYGMIRNQDKPFNSYGIFTLKKRSQNSNPWIITGSTLAPAGSIRMEVSRIPSEFHGVWASPGACGHDDPMTIRITDTKVDYLKDIEQTGRFVVGDQSLSYSVTFQTEGQSGRALQKRQTLSDNGQKLISDENITRVRCPISSGR